MHASSPKSLPAIGFFTVTEHAEYGLFGGYLILNAVGRPLEFHCTAPVKPNRAQEILYGPTLKPYLYGDQIGSTLLTKAKVEPLLVCTDIIPALAVRELVATPIVLVVPDASSSVSDGPVTAHSNSLVHFELGARQLAVLATHPDDRDQVLSRWLVHADGFDLREPFGRIREAIEEAQKSARQPQPAAA